MARTVSMVSASVGSLVVAVAQHPGEPQRQAAGVTRRALHTVERHLDHLLRSQLHDVALGAAHRQLLKPRGLPLQHRVGHALERLAQHHVAAAGRVEGAQMNIGQLSCTPARPPLDGQHHQIQGVDRLDLEPAGPAAARLVRRGQ